MRPESVCKLLDSVEQQTLLPNELIIVDGSTNDNTRKAIEKRISTLSIQYHLVTENDRGLTRQRNLGIKQVHPGSEVIVFLDDDVVLDNNFLKELIDGFSDSEVIGSDGLIINESGWFKCEKEMKNHIFIDGFCKRLPQRDRLRQLLGLYPAKMQPGIIPPYGHGKGSLPPSGKLYEVEHIMGGIAAYRNSIFDVIKFSIFFEGYGLYEDFDFSVRASRFGKLITNTKALCEHHHAPSGRPNNYKYGKMVVRNGYYVWRLKHPNPSMINIVKWYSITILLMLLRLSNGITGPNRKEGFDDFCGRFIALTKLLAPRPAGEGE